MLILKPSKLEKGKLTKLKPPSKVCFEKNNKTIAWATTSRFYSLTPGFIAHFLLLFSPVCYYKGSRNCNKSVFCFIDFYSANYVIKRFSAQDLMYVSDILYLSDCKSAIRLESNYCWWKCK